MHRARIAALTVAFGVLMQPGARAQQPSAAAAKATGTPTIDQLISLKRAGSATVSPNGQWVASPT